MAIKPAAQSKNKWRVNAKRTIKPKVNSPVITTAAISNTCLVGRIKPIQTNGHSKIGSTKHANNVR